VAPLERVHGPDDLAANSRPPGLVPAALAALALFLPLSVAGIVLRIDGRDFGLVLIFAGSVVVGAFHWWSRRAWQRHRARDD
jgi:hypothetical protein